MVRTMLCNVKAASYTIAKVNEDVCGWAPDCAWVLDGSTGLMGKRLVAQENGSDAQWYAAKFSAFLKTHMPDSQMPLTELFSLGVRTVWSEFLHRAGGSVAKEDTPCTLGTAIRIRDGHLEYINVGDCTLLLRYRDGSVAELSDTTLSAMDANTLALAQSIAEKEKKNICDCRGDILPELRRVRMTMNTPQGYISLANDETSVLSAKCGRVKLEKLRDVCLLSDGFAQYFKLFSLCAGAEAFMDKISAQEPQTLFHELLAAQKEDPTFCNYPRFKLSDDATVVYFSVQKQ